jgi:hypothetical protein
MCTVPRKNGTFRDSAHKGLQLVQGNYISIKLIYFIPSTHAHSNKINTSSCVFKVCIVVELHAALVVYSWIVYLYLRWHVINFSVNCIYYCIVLIVYYCIKCTSDWRWKERMKNSLHFTLYVAVEIWSSYCALSRDAPLFVGPRTYPLQWNNILNCPCVLPICKQTK